MVRPVPAGDRDLADLDGEEGDGFLPQSVYLSHQSIVNEPTLNASALIPFPGGRGRGLQGKAQWLSGWRQMTGFSGFCRSYSRGAPGCQARLLTTHPAPPQSREGRCDSAPPSLRGKGVGG